MVVVPTVESLVVPWDDELAGVCALAGSAVSNEVTRAVVVTIAVRRRPGLAKIEVKRQGLAVMCVLG